MTEFIPVPTQNIATFCETIVKMCGAIRDKGEPYQLNEVFGQLFSGRAQLWVAQQQGVTVGHIVTKVVITPESNSRVLLLWKMHGVELDTWSADGYKKCIEVARYHNLTEVQFTGRKGWSPFLKKLAPEVGAEHREITVHAFTVNPTQEA
jgi:hypothetical protein